MPAHPHRSPHEALSIAQTYAKHQWQPFARNILHGEDPPGESRYTGRVL